MQQANDKTFIMVQIEDVEAIDEIEAIAEIDGVDIIFIGPADLSHSLGVPVTSRMARSGTLSGVRLKPAMPMVNTVGLPDWITII